MWLWSPSVSLPPRTTLCPKWTRQKPCPKLHPGGQVWQTHSGGSLFQAARGRLFTTTWWSCRLGDRRGRVLGVVGISTSACLWWANRWCKVSAKCLSSGCKTLKTGGLSGDGRGEPLPPGHFWFWEEDEKSADNPYAGRHVCNGAWRSEGLQVASYLLPSKWHYHHLILLGVGTGILLYFAPEVKKLCFRKTHFGNVICVGCNMKRKKKLLYQKTSLKYTQFNFMCGGVYHSEWKDGIHGHKRLLWSFMVIRIPARQR